LYLPESGIGEVHNVLTQELNHLGFPAASHLSQNLLVSHARREFIMIALEQLTEEAEQTGQNEAFAPRGQRNSSHGAEGIVGSSPALQAAVELALTVAPVRSTVMIHGETGTGKELIAGLIHQRSPRSHMPFVKLNCAAIPMDLLESELFGYERGAFTGALTRKLGRFEIANRGSLFLDEIGDIRLELQAKLLRVLQEGEFERLGSNQTVRVNVRLICATHRDLADLVETRQFRSDLYYRLNVFPITIPPLRERREDIAPLVTHFVRTFARAMNKNIEEVPEEAMGAIQEYSWPGNIRELRNFIERSVILSEGTKLRAPLHQLMAAPVTSSSGTPITLKDAEREHISKILNATRGVVAGPRGAAARLGMKRSTLYFRMRKLGIPLPARSLPVVPESGRKLA
jgi:formate hydrogenlyase transcriptional activator